MSLETNVEAQVYELLLKSGPLPPKVLALAIGIQVEEIISILDEMAKKGFVIRLDGERYVAIPKITEVLDQIDILKRDLGAIEKALKEGIGSLEVKLGESYAKIADVLFEKLNNVIRMIDSILEETTKAYRETISKNLEAMNLVTAAMMSIADHLRKSIDNLKGSQKKMSTDIKNLEDTLLRVTAQNIQSVASMARSELEELSRSSVEVITSSYEEFERSIDSLQEAFINNIKGVGEATKKIIVLIGDMVSKIRILVDGVLSTISKELESLGESIPDELIRFLSEIMSKEIVDIEQAVGEYRNSVVAQIKNVVAKQDEALRILNTNITKLIQDIDPTFDKLGEEFQQRIQKQLDETFERAITRIEESREALERSLKNIKTVARNVSESLKSTVLSNLEQVVESMNIGVAETLTVRLRDIRRSIELLTHVVVDLDAKLRALSTHISTQIESMNTKISDDINRFLSQLRKRLEGTQNMLSRSVQAVIQKIPSREVLEPIESSIRSNIDAIVEKLSSTLISIFNELLSDIGGIVEERLSRMEKPVTRKTTRSTKSRGRSRRPKTGTRPSLDIKAIKDQILELLEGYKKRITTIIQEQLGIYGSGLVDIVLNNVRLIVEDLKQATMAKIRETESAIRDEIIWLGSEASSRMKLLQDKINTMLGEMRSSVNTQLKTVVVEVEKSLKEKVEMLNRNVDSLDAGINEFKRKQLSRIEEMRSGLSNAFEESLSPLISAMNAALERIDGTFVALKDLSTSRKNTIMKAIEEEMEGVKTKLRTEIATRIENTIEEIDKFSGTMEAAVQEALKNIDEGCDVLRGSLRELVESVKKAVSERVSTKIALMVDRVEATIESEKNKIMSTLGETQEEIQNALLEKISDIDRIIEETDVEADRIRSSLKDAIEKIKQPIIETYGESTKRIVETIESTGDALRQEISRSMQTFELESQKVLEGMDRELESFEAAFQKDVITPHQESIGRISKSIGDIESQLREQVGTLRTPISNILSEIKGVLEQEKVETLDSMTKIISTITEKINDIVEATDRIPSSFMKAIETYVKEIRERPKGVFLSYGRKVLNTIMRLMIESAKESVIIISPIIDRALEEMLESTKTSVLIEIYTKSKPEKQLGKAFITRVPSLPDNIVIVSKDETETLIILENKDKKYVGIIVEDIPLTKLLLGLIK